VHRGLRILRPLHCASAAAQDSQFHTRLALLARRTPPGSGAAPPAWPLDGALPDHSGAARHMGRTDQCPGERRLRSRRPEVRRRTPIPSRNDAPARRVCHHGHTRSLLPAVRDRGESDARPLDGDRKETHRPRYNDTYSDHVPPPWIRIGRRAHQARRACRVDLSIKLASCGRATPKRRSEARPSSLSATQADTP
jgi:hypothetical protein